jgi:ABC-type nitrate/sulfonate/bicarbonate transport system substrate-binding protein
MRSVLAAIIAAGGASVLLGAEGTEVKSTLEAVSLGESWFGPKLGVEDLKGRVVLIEFWGRN